MTLAKATLENPKSRFEAPLIWLLSIALMAGPIIVLRQNTNDDTWAASLWLFGLVITWSVFGGRALIREPLWQRNPLAFRLAELALFALLLRIGVWAIVEGFPTSAEWQLYLVKPWQLFGGIWWFYLILTVGIWAWVNDLIRLFHRLEVSENELGFYRLPESERRVLRETMLLRTDRSTLTQMFFTRWMIGAFILVICAAFSTINLTQFVDAGWFTDLPRFSLSPALLTALLIYFFCGLWLLSYSRYTALFARWLINGTQPHPSVAQTWRRTSLLLLGCIGLLAAFLPIGSTVPIALIVQSLLWVVASIGLFVINLFVLLFALLASLFTNGESTESVIEQIQPMPEIAPAFGPTAAGEPPVPSDALGGFTSIVLVIVLIAALLFLWQRMGGLAGARPLWQQMQQRLRQWWHWFVNGVQDQLIEARIFVAEQLGREAPLRRNDPRRRIDPAQLPAREQIRYFYLRTVQRAQDKGVARQAHQTPAEFLSELQTEWPESAEDSEHLTEAFLHARYSPVRVQADQVNPIKEAWGRLRQNLQKRRKRSN